MTQDDREAVVDYVTFNGNGDKPCFDIAPNSPVPVELGTKTNRYTFDIRNRTGSDLKFSCTVTGLSRSGTKIDFDPSKIDPFEVCNPPILNGHSFKFEVKRRDSGIPPGCTATGYLEPEEGACNDDHPLHARGHTDWHIDC